MDIKKKIVLITITLKANIVIRETNSIILIIIITIINVIIREVIIIKLIIVTVKVTISYHRTWQNRAKQQK